jgi:butyrate kinase
MLKPSATIRRSTPDMAEAMDGVAIVVAEVGPAVTVAAAGVAVAITGVAVAAAAGAGAVEAEASGAEPGLIRVEHSVGYRFFGNSLNH